MGNKGFTGLEFIGVMAIGMFIGWLGVYTAARLNGNWICVGKLNLGAYEEIISSIRS